MACARRRKLCVLLAACAAPLAPARAQEILPARTDVAGARTPPDYAVESLHVGSWVAAPELTLKTGYDGNLYGEESNATSDGYAVISPSLRLQSDWGHNAVNLAARADLTRYFRFGIQDTDEYALSGGGRLDLDRWSLSGRVSLSRTAERRGANGTPLTRAEPSVYRNFAQSMELKRDAGVLSTGLSVSHEDISYSDITTADGVVRSQQARDSEQWTVRGRIDYAPSDNGGLGFNVTYQHAEVPFPDRFSNESLSIGGDAAIDTGMFRLELEGSYLDRRFDNPLFTNFSGFVYRGALSWYPTPLLTLSARTSRSLENSGAFRDTADGTVQAGTLVARSYRIQADYELLRNLVLTGNLSWRSEKFPEIERSSVSRSQEIEGEYKFNRFVAFGAYLRHECKNSSVTFTVRRFCVALAGLSLTLKR